MFEKFFANLSQSSFHMPTNFLSPLILVLIFDAISQKDNQTLDKTFYNDSLI